MRGGNRMADVIITTFVVGILVGFNIGYFIGFSRGEKSQKVWTDHWRKEYMWAWKSWHETGISLLELADQTGTKIELKAPERKRD